MFKKQQTKNTISHLCRGCLSEGSFRSLGESFIFEGLEEVYSVLMRDTFDIVISAVIGEDSVSTYTICNNCVERLRAAALFKKQVLDCEQRFQCLVQEYHDSFCVDTEDPTSPDQPLKNNNTSQAVTDSDTDVVMSETVFINEHEAQREYECPEISPGEGSRMVAKTKAKKKHLKLEDMGDEETKVIDVPKFDYKIEDVSEDEIQEYCAEFLPEFEDESNAKFENQGKEDRIIQTATKRKRSWTRRNACLYCGKLVTNFIRHIKRSHANEREVIEVFSINDLDIKERKRKHQMMTDSLRNRGNCSYNSKISKENGDQIVPNRRIPKAGLLTTKSYVTAWHVQA